MKPTYTEEDKRPENPYILKDEEAKTATSTYLDSCIQYWRAESRAAVKKSQERLIADCYIDAYQCVRVTLIGEVLP